MSHPLPFDICQRLKEAGLPQPEPTFGQMWFTPPDGEIIILGGFYKMSGYITALNIVSVIAVSDVFLKDVCFFHPDAEYILSHLPKDLFLTRHSNGDWVVCEMEHQNGIVFDLTKEYPPAPTAALAYLAIHEKTD